MDSKDSDKRKLEDDDHSSPNPKQRKVIGPSLPPTGSTAPTDTGSGSADSDTGSDSDDDFGPCLPPSNPLPGSAPPVADSSIAVESPEVTQPEKENQRDQWMLHPPSQSDWTSKIDPTQLRNRKFNTGKSATGPKNMDSSWVESPEERMKRLQDSVMGVGSTTKQTQVQGSNTKSKEDQIKRFNEKNRKQTRLESSDQAKEEDDDPSARAFDREKDMAVAGKISSAQRREMVKKAADYNTRFSKGSFL
ncbi:hypothetical protein N7541_000863 [Penicillium brevicompactum]|uniref:DUF3752 domain-containing protein n=1 Tax=Penicillium brevicompactum TaxID=5074 RepID=A0A9W9RUY9_PENBR|nr:uncharacterized protein N7506_001430 [Penicillium brevicompactum]KAJ5348177.1 hypothetical protein N7506_001430 [Penicillium brevicompactum]KAJ5366922.1 hypothetical protein N7541_000863 [Penicillium brevicompactum]